MFMPNRLFITGIFANAHIFERYVRVLFMYGSQFTGDRELVKDCIQDVFVKIYSNRSNLRPTDNIKYYLFAALRNSLLNNLKRNKVRFGGGGEFRRCRKSERAGL